MPLLYNEDAALKAKLSGLLVTDVNDPGGRPVPVRYRSPENEMADVVYPILILDEADWSEAPERAHSGYSQLAYVPEGYAAPDPGVTLMTEMPRPINIDWTLTLYCRKALHRASIIAQLAQFAYLPARLGFLQVPQDQSLRRLEVIGGPATSSVLDAQGKRLLTAVWKLRTTGELIWAPVDSIPEATSVDLTVTPTGPVN
jgi:hypothetical protein